jgi:UDP-glucose 4-epimerase
MSRVLLTGGAGTIGRAIARRLLADPTYEVRISDRRPAPQWMREGCEIHDGDLRVPAQALAAAKGCSHVIHLAAFAGTPAQLHALPHTSIEFENALHSAVLRAAIDREVERFVFVSSPMVFERAELFPTPERHLQQCPVALSACGLSRLSAERCCRAAHVEHGFPFTICRPFGAFGPGAYAPGETPDAEPGTAHVVGELIGQALAGRRPLEILGSGEQTITPTHVDDLAEGVIAAMGSPAALNEDFNLAAARELTVAEIARIAWEACGEDPDAFVLKRLPAPELDVQRSWPSVQKAHELLGWQARIEAEDGIAAIVRSLRERATRREARAPAND